MKKLMFSTAAILALSLSAFAGTPETKGEAKPEAKTQEVYTYHYLSESNGKINFAEGPATNCTPPGSKPCEWTSDEPMNTSEALTPAEIEALADVNLRRS